MVAIDAVSKNCLLEEISNKGLWSDAVTLARRLGNIGPADSSPLNRGVSVTNGHSNQAFYGSRLTLCFHGSGWQVTHRLVFMLLLSGMECVRWELISGCVKRCCESLGRASRIRSLDKNEPKRVQSRDAWHPQTRQDRDAILLELQEVLASPHFCNSKRYPALLKYIVEETLAGNSEAAEGERTLGVEVFDRPPAYDTNADTVVRYTAGEVRKRLSLYYHEHRIGGPADPDLAPGELVHSGVSPRPGRAA